jgi:hypothetical protein
MKKVNEFVQEGKIQGYSKVMVSVPWYLTEEKEEGIFDFNSHSKDYVGLACANGLKLLIVLNMEQLPAWAATESACQRTNKKYCPLPETN